MNKTIVSIPMYGGGLMSFYYIELVVHSQILQVIVDTGSSDLILAGQNCRSLDVKELKDCTVYDREPIAALRALNVKNDTKECSRTPYIGSTSKDLQLICYESGFILFYTAYDTIQIGNLSGDVNFGSSVVWSKSLNYYGNDGIWGLAHPAISKINWKAHNQDAFTTILESNNLSDAFSLCFNSGNKGGGRMFLGGGYMEGMNLTKVSHKGWYTIGIKKLKLGNHTIKASSPEAIVDSGSTLFIVDVHVLRQITHILCPIVLPNEPLLDCHEKLIGKKSLPIGQDVINRCPILRVLVPDYLEPFTNFELSFKPSDYWLGDGKNYLLGISGGNSMILGGTVLRSHLVYFDRKNSVVGFKQVKNCSTDVIFVETPSFLSSRSEIFSHFSLLWMMMCILSFKVLVIFNK